MDLLEQFLRANPQVDPNVRLAWQAASARDAAYLARTKCAGYYRRYAKGAVIRVIPSHCTKPGRGYSWPGLMSDRTLWGVQAHEIGHHAHMSRPDAARITTKIEQLRERPVTSYEPNPSEIWAEAFRLFLLNPDLLKAGRPQRYGLIVDCGFSPIEPRSWQAVLGNNCPPRFLARVGPWVAKGGTV
jgi:hypothetical protein